MATPKTGPVKPPVLDMAARKNTTDTKTGPADKKSEPEQATSKTPEPKASAPKTPTPKKPEQALPLFPLATGLVGAALGLGLSYGVAVLGYWPQPAPAPDTSSAEIARLSADIKVLTATQAELKAELATVGDATTQTQAQLDDTSDAVATTTADVEKLIATPQSGGVDATQLEALRADLDNRISAIAAGASPDLANQLAAELKTNAQTLADLAARIAEVETAQATPAPADTQPQQSAQLPLAFAGFEAALRNGNPFAVELAAIATNLPGLTVPTELVQSAQSGLSSPSAIAAAFNTAIPGLLAAIPTNPDASLQQRLMDQARSLLALRPVGAVSGDSPEALIAQIEAALEAPDFATAETLVAALPQTLRQLIPSIASDISTHAGAEAFLNTARSAALAPTAEGTPQ